VFAMVLFSSVITLSTTAFQLFTDYRRDLKNIEGSLALVESNYLEILTQSLWTLDNEQLELQMGSLMRLTDVEYAELKIDGEDKLVRGKRRAENVLIHTFPIIHNNQNRNVRLGELELHISLDDVYQRLWDKALIVLASNALKTFLVSGFMLFFFHYLVTRHLDRMSEYVRSLDWDTSHAPLKLQKSDRENELDDVVHAINEMWTRMMQSEERFAFMKSAANDGLWDWNIITGYCYLSPRWKEILGYEESELMDNRDAFTDSLHPEDRSRVLAELEMHLKKRTPYDEEFRLQQKSGHYVWVHAKGQAIWDEDGTPLRMAGLISDISARKAAEKEVRDSEARLAGILRLAPEGVITTNGDGEIKVFSQGAERIFGYKADEVIGQSMEILMPERFRSQHHIHVIDFDKSSVEYKAMTERSEIAGLRKDGFEFPAEASVSKLVLGNEKLFTVVLHDITEQKKSESRLLSAKEEAEIANRAKSEFLANMSHELRTPLNAIIGFSEMIQGEIIGPVGDSRYTDYAESIKVSGAHLLGVITDILDISKIEARESEIDESDVDIRKVMDDCTRIIQERAETAKVNLSSNVAENVGNLRGDERRIKQIVLNLLSNAIKFTPPDGAVTVSVHRDISNCMVIEIADTGVGILAEDLPTIAKPFTQAHNQAMTRGHQQGTGLGLSIAKSLAELHDGIMSIESTIGEGTAVTVIFPAERSVEKS